MSTSGGATAPINFSRRRMIKPKMDLAKALSTMGFSTSRTLDPSGGHDARSELNAALSRRMNDLEKKKKLASQKDKSIVADKIRDDVRTLHEAYQFLSRKYIRERARESNRFSSDTMDMEDDEEDVEEEVYEDQMDGDVFMDYNNLERKNSSKRRLSSFSKSTHQSI